MSNSPLPCPFCGAAPRVKVWPNDPYNLRGCVEVSCENNYCPVQASAEENSIEAATANWNARVTLAPEERARIDWPEVNRLIVAYGNSQFDCGEHGGDDEKPEPYEKVHARATAAREALEAYLRRAMNSGGEKR